MPALLPMLQQQTAACCPNETFFKQQVSHVPIHLGLLWLLVCAGMECGKVARMFVRYYTHRPSP
jgi:hypothetical protein